MSVFERQFSMKTTQNSILIFAALMLLSAGLMSFVFPQKDSVFKVNRKYRFS